MNLIPILLIHKAQREREEARRRANSSSSKKSNSSSRNSHSSSSKSYSEPKTLSELTSRYYGYSRESKLYSRVLNAMESNPDIKRVYSKIHTHITSCINVFVDEACVKYAHEPAEYARFQEAESKVKSVLSRFSIETATYYSDGIPRYNPDGITILEKFTLVSPRPLTLMGIGIKEKMVTGNPFRDRYEKYISEHPTFEEDYARAEKEVIRLEKNTFLLKISSRRRERLVEARKELKSATAIKEQAQTYREQAELFDTISNEERGLIATYIEARNAIVIIPEEERKEKIILRELGGYYSYHYTADIMGRFYQEAVDGLSEEERAIYESAPRVIMETLAKADETTFATLSEPEHTDNKRFSVDNYLNNKLVESSIAVLDNVPLDELAGDTSDSAE